MVCVSRVSTYVEPFFMTLFLLNPVTILPILCELYAVSFGDPFVRHFIYELLIVSLYHKVHDVFDVRIWAVWAIPSASMTSASNSSQCVASIHKPQQHFIEHQFSNSFLFLPSLIISTHLFLIRPLKGATWNRKNYLGPKSLWFPLGAASGDFPQCHMLS